MSDFTRRTFMAGTLAAACTPRGARAAGPPALRLVEVARDLFVAQGRHELFTAENGGHIANLSVIIGREAIAVVDTGGSMAAGRALLAAIRARSDLPVRYVINTHMHPDHVFGNAAFIEKDTVFVGHSKLPRALAVRGDRYLAANAADLGAQSFEGTRIVPPTLLVEDRMQLDLGGRAITLVARKTSHTDNDLTVRDEATGTLILGDLLFSGHIPTLDGSIRGWIAVLARLEAEQKAARVVPGHGAPSMSWPEALAPIEHYLGTLAADVRRMIKEGKTLSEASEAAGFSEKTAWLLFDDYHRRNVAAAFAELEWE